MELLGALLGIVLIDIILSGDNALVIGMAAHGLAHHQRRLAILVGGAAAIVFRILLTGVASALLLLPYLKLAGGLLLAVIAVKLLTRNLGHSKLSSSATGGLLGALWVILSADAVMSMDNILAVAAASRGHLTALAFGLLLSMGILLFVGSQVAGLLDRFGWLNYLGAAVIAWTAGDLIAADSVVHNLFPAVRDGSFIVPALTCVVVVTVTLAYRSLRPRPLME